MEERNIAVYETEGFFFGQNESVIRRRQLEINEQQEDIPLEFKREMSVSDFKDRLLYGNIVSTESHEMKELDLSQGMRAVLKLSAEQIGGFLKTKSAKCLDLSDPNDIASGTYAIELFKNIMQATLDSHNMHPQSKNQKKGPLDHATRKTSPRSPGD